MLITGRVFLGRKYRTCIHTGTHSFERPVENMFEFTYVYFEYSCSFFLTPIRTIHINCYYDTPLLFYIFPNATKTFITKWDELFFSLLTAARSLCFQLLCHKCSCLAVAWILWCPKIFFGVVNPWKLLDDNFPSSLENHCMFLSYCIVRHINFLFYNPRVLASTYKRFGALGPKNNVLSSVILDLNTRLYLTLRWPCIVLNSYNKSN